MEIAQEKHSFLQLDGVRALAAFFVLCVHTAAASGMLSDPDSPLRAFAARLDVGVAIFFLLSGFLLYRPFAQANLTASKAPAAGRYCWRRFMRIVPTYWAALTVATIWIGLQGTVFTVKGIPTYYGFLQSYSGDTVIGGIAQAWTLDIEVTFYLMIPLFALAVRALARKLANPLRAEVIGLVLLALCGLAFKLWVVLGLGASAVQLGSVETSVLPWYLEQFALGMALAVVSLRIRPQATLERGLTVLNRFPGLSWLVALLALVAVSEAIGLDGSLSESQTRTQALERYWLYSLVALAVLVPAIFGPVKSGLTRKFLASRPLRFLGLISYSFYLYHLALLIQLSRWGFNDFAQDTPVPFITWLVVAFAGTVVISTASYYLVERPSLILKNVFGRKAPADRHSPARAATAQQQNADA